jgi:imidazolonepropionase
MKCIRDLNQLITLKPCHDKDGRNLLAEDLGIISNAAIIYDEEKIVWVGDTNSIPQEYKNIETISKPGHVITPEIVDSHTHLVFGGNRAFEYSMRLNGADYEDIANAGGGILSTMKATLEESIDTLFTKAIERINRIHSYGIGTIEIKSGYALTYEREKEITLLIQKIKEHFDGKVQIHNTFLAAHAIPKEYKNSKDYLSKVVMPLLEELAPMNVIDSVDIFEEVGYFSADDVVQLFNLAQKLNIPTRIHADEFNDNKGAVKAAKFKSLSADHLLCTTEDGVKALAQSNTVATLLPGTAFFLGKPLANAQALFEAGCKVALASDYNPGSSHCDNLVLVASMAAKNLNMNVSQLWASITLNAAHSLNLKEQGAIIKGLKPRFSLFNCESIDEITYSWGRNFSTSF